MSFAENETSRAVAELQAGTTTLDGWIRRADEALYAAKDGGRNRVEVRSR